MFTRTSLCVIAKNEESCLGECLASVRERVQEIILVDTGSTDRTKEIALSLGANVFDFPWINDFAAARNECLRHATGDWILWMDADERVDSENGQKLLALFDRLKRDQPAAFTMSCRCLPEAESGAATVVNHIRLFPNHPQARWRYRVHEQILPALNELRFPVFGTDIVIDHTGYQDAALVHQKTQRNLKLLELDYADKPNDAFVLFNLGWTLLTLGQTAKALEFLRQSLGRSNPGDSIVRKAYALVAQTHLQLGQPSEALAACRAGRARYPDDAELLMIQGKLLKDAGDLGQAELCFKQLLSGKTASRENGETPGEVSFIPVQFTSAEEGLRGYKARFELGQVVQRLGRQQEAEELWQAVLIDRPSFAPVRLAIARLNLHQGKWSDLDTVLDPLMNKSTANAVADTSLNGNFFGRGSDQAQGEALILRARGQIARKDYETARTILEGLVADWPAWAYPRVILSHALLQMGDLPAAERVLRDLLMMDPCQTESWTNLAKLLRNQNRFAEALAACRAGLVHCPSDPHLLWLQGVMLHEAGDLIGAETCLLAVVGGSLPTPHSREHVFSARHHLAQIYQQLARLADAEGQWRTILAEQPDYQPAVAGLTNLYRLQGRQEEADALEEQHGGVCAPS